MATRAKCPNCDQPLATEADHDTRGCDRCARFDATCPHASLCWSAFAMTCPPVDWRARAGVAERERDEVRRRAREAAQTIIEAIGADGPQNVEESAVRVVARLEATEQERDEARAALANVEAAARSLDDGPWPPPVVPREAWTTMHSAEKVVRDAIGTWRSLAEKWRGESERDAATHTMELDALIGEVTLVRAERDEARRLLAAVALGKLRRCETCGEHLATRRWRGTSVDVCDRCFDEDKRDAADAWEALDEEACEDLPHAAALRAAMEAAK